MKSIGFINKTIRSTYRYYEQSQVNSQEGLRSGLNNLDNKLSEKIKNIDKKLSGEIKSVDNKLDTLNSKTESEAKSLSNELIKKIKDLELRIALSPKYLLVKILGIIVGTVSIAVTILKI